MVGYEGRLPACPQHEEFIRKICGQFVDRIRSISRYGLLANGNEPQNPNKLVVAATFEMTKT